jgi:hypothetical protein
METNYNMPPQSKTTQQDYNQKQENSSASIEGKVDEILGVLRGTIDGTEGLVSMVKHISNDLHDRDTGIIPRVANLEAKNQRVAGYLLGASFVGGCVAWVIELLFGNRH